MTTHSQTTDTYSAAFEDASVARIRAGRDAVITLRLFTQADVERFVSFLNENRIEPVHVKDCLRDVLFEHFADAVSPD